MLDRLEQAIEDLEAQNEGGEDAPAVYLPEELADKRALREQVRQAMDDLASQEGLRHINLTGKDARLMKTRHGIVPGYNAQSMVSPTEVDDEASGMLITAVDVVDEPTDYGQFTPMLEQAEETTGTKACMTLADVDAVAASQRGSDQRQHLVPSVRPSRRAAEVKVMVDEFPQAQVPGDGRQRGCGYGRDCSVAASIGCSLFPGGFLFQNHYPRFRGAPSGFFKGCPQGRPSVDSGLG